jgi:glycosyltransferase involved in cell wall biosynthesis
MFLTIGMATYDDYDGVYFSLQALKAYHDLTDTELVVIDSKPNGCQDTKNVCNSVGARYFNIQKQGTSAPRNHVFEVAKGKFVMCMDCHVLFAKNSIKRLKEFLAKKLQTKDIFQGPLLYDDQKSISTHFDPQWRGQMYGTWGTDQRGYKDAPFEIPMQGLGMFCMRKEAWPKFNPLFRGFGGEEGYIHEKVRQRGGKAICLPWLKWVHRFGRPKGVPYRLTVEDRIINYLIGWHELGRTKDDIIQHFSESVPKVVIDKCMKEFEKLKPQIALLKKNNKPVPKPIPKIDKK